jgi:uncharacterized protein (DUF58 family)
VSVRRHRKRIFKLTREGRVFVVATLGVGIAAVNTANNLMFLVLGLLLSMLLTSGVLSDLVLMRLRVSRARQGRVFAGTPAYFALHVSNGKSRLRSMSFELVDRVEGSDGARGYVLDLAAGESKEIVVAHTFTRRGRARLTGIETSTRYPFDIIEKGDVHEAEEELVVYPRLLEAEPSLTGADAQGELVLRASSRGSDVVGLREIREGEIVRDVHAGRSAALGELVRRERAAEGARAVDVTVDTRVAAGDEAALARFEEAISVAATVVLRRVERGDVVTVRTPRGLLCRASQPTEIDGALTALALLAPETAP